MISNVERNVTIILKQLLFQYTLCNQDKTTFDSEEAYARGTVTFLVLSARDMY